VAQKYDFSKRYREACHEPKAPVTINWDRHKEAKLCPCGCARLVKPDPTAPKQIYYSDTCRKIVNDRRKEKKKC
jgi:hypothetical protein